MYNAIIIGAGPAGLAAAVYFARQKMKFLILTGHVGGQMIWSSDIEDYLGFHLLNGQDLVKQFRAHLADYEGTYELHEGEHVTNIQKSPPSEGGVEGVFQIVTEKSSYESKSVLIVTGTKRRELGVPGEKEFYGKGVTYCATCDAPLFKGKKVFVIGGGNSAMDAALFAEKYATDVSIITINAELKGDPVMLSKIVANPRIHVLALTKTTKIIGNSFVTGIGYSGEDGIEHEEACQGVFIEIGLMPSTGFADIVEKDQWKQIVIDKRNNTSVPGIFAAGDCTDVADKQIGIAVGEGSKAALELIKYLQTSHV
jgi:alkyl hydroperoxide reductase subunit F